MVERGWLSSNLVVLQDEGSTAIVDTGYAAHNEQTVEIVEALAGGRPVDHLLNTHLHSDHCGGNAAVQARWPAVRTWIPPGQAAQVRDWDPVALTYEPTGQWCPRFVFDNTLTPGSELLLGGAMWQVHAAPGHDPHSIVLFEPASRTLVSADALWQHGFGVVFPELEGEQAFDEVAATLDLIEGLAPATVLPGHGPAFSDLAGALATARSKLAAFRSQPSRHATHAAKVLLKFKLLEVQRMSLDSLLVWCSTTHYFALVHRRWFLEIPFPLWIRRLLDELIRHGALGQDAQWVFDA